MALPLVVLGVSTAPRRNRARRQRLGAYLRAVPASASIADEPRAPRGPRPRLTPGTAAAAAWAYKRWTLASCRVFLLGPSHHVP